MWYTWPWDSSSGLHTVFIQGLHTFFPGLFAGHDPARGVGSGVYFTKLADQVGCESGGDQNWHGSGRVGVRNFSITTGPVGTGHPGTIRPARSDPTRQKPCFFFPLFLFQEAVCG